MSIIALQKSVKTYHKPERFTIVCAWCDRVQHGSEWRVEAARPSGRAVSHGICPECYRQQCRRLGMRK